MTLSPLVQKLAVIGGLGLLLLLSLRFLDPIVEERRGRSQAAQKTITSAWGPAQDLIGPVLVVPLETRELAPIDASLPPSPPVPAGVVYLLPDALDIDGEIAPERRKLGIYEAAVYAATLRLSGKFTRRSAAELGLGAVELRWDQATLVIGVPDLRGVDAAIALDWGAGHAVFEPGTEVAQLGSGLHARVPAQADGVTELTFSTTLPLRGSEGLRFAPLGVSNRVALRSSWPNPGFGGAFLPVERHVGAGGFTASWKMSHYGRQYPQSFSDWPAAALERSMFGVDLHGGIDAYRHIERATKYGALFIALVFTTFFLFEVTAGQRIHPFQYALVGAGVALFFLLLLSMSEVMRFWIAYVAAAGAITALLSVYGVSVLKSRRRAAVGSAGLAAGFGLLYVVLRAEDYALLFGSLALLAGLAIIMRVTRHIDWYARENLADSA